MIIGYSLGLIVVYLHIAHLLFIWRPIIEDRSRRRQLFSLFILAFAMRLTTAIFITMKYGTYYPDETFYIANGIRIIRDLQFPFVFQLADLVHYAGSVNIGYQLVNSFHFLLYPDVFLCKITNCFFGALLILPAFLLARRLFSEKIALVSVIVMAIWPNFIYWASFNLKDTLVTFFSILAIYLYYRYNQEKRNVMTSIYVLLALLVLLTLRIYIGLFLIGLMSFHLTMTSQANNKKKIFGIAIIFVFSLVLFQIDYLNDFFNYAVSTDTLTGVHESSFSRTQDENFFMGNFQAGDPIAVIIGFFHFMFTPSPYRLNFEYLTDFMKITNILWYLIFPFFLIGAWNLGVSRFKEIHLVLYFSLALMLFYSFLPWLGIVRHRTQFMPFVILVAVVGFYSQIKNRSMILVSLWATLFIGISAFEAKYYFGWF